MLGPHAASAGAADVTMGEAEEEDDADVDVVDAEEEEEDDEEADEEAGEAVVLEAAAVEAKFETSATEAASDATMAETSTSAAPPISSMSASAELGTLRDFLGISMEDVEATHEEVCSEPYKKSVREVMGTTGVIPDEYWAGLQRLQTWLSPVIAYSSSYRRPHCRQQAWRASPRP